MTVDSSGNIPVRSTNSARTVDQKTLPSLKRMNILKLPLIPSRSGDHTEEVELVQDHQQFVNVPTVGTKPLKHDQSPAAIPNALNAIHPFVELLKIQINPL